MSTDFGYRLKIVREEKGFKREDVAKKIGTSAAIIGRYERNERTPSIDIAKNIAEALEVSLDYLVGDTTVLLKDKKVKPSQMFEGYKPPKKNVKKPKGKK